jgi:hypothetical protein
LSAVVAAEVSAAMPAVVALEQFSIQTPEYQSQVVRQYRQPSVVEELQE